VRLPMTVVSVNTTTEEIKITGHGLLTDDIITISSTGTLPSPLVANTFYYAIFVDANHFKLATAAGGSAINLRTTGSGTITVLQINKQPVKIVLTDLNLKDERGLTLYSTDDVSIIQVYRAQLNVNSTWTPPVLLAELSKDAFDIWYYQPLTPPYAEETYEDNVQEISYNPFTSANILKYLVKNIVVHKNRLILVNNLGLESRTSNILHYSELDNAQSLPPGNIRDIQSGDSDILVSAVSAGDYLYLFKSNKIYAILGDVEDGQMIDIANSIGCPFKNMSISYDNRMVYFLNQYGIFAIEAGQIVNLDQERISNYFDPELDGAIDFSLIDEHGFSFVELKEREIYFHVPLKNENQNSLVIILDTANNRFKTYAYAHPPFVQKNTKDISSGERQVLIGSYDGMIHQVTKGVNDAGQPISYLMRTKEFVLGSNFVNKKFKMLKVFGKYFNDLQLFYWLDGIRGRGILASRKAFNGQQEATVFVTSSGLNNTLAVEISGSDANEAPVEIHEILIGYDNLKGMNR